MAIAAASRIFSFSFHVHVRLRSPVLQVVAPSARLDEISLLAAPQLPKANHFLAYLALLAGPGALSRPATAQKSLGRGRFPPCAPPCAATRRPGWATTPSPKPKIKAPPSAEDRGQPQSKTHRTKKSGKSSMS